MAEFDFVEEYRQLQPSADRDTINARNAAFVKAKDGAAKSNSRVVDLAHFAFRLPARPDHDADAWFLEVMRTDDSAFSLQHEAEEAARIATLVLKDRIASRYFGTPVAVHAAAFAGKRATVDNHDLSITARRALHNLVRKRGASSVIPKIAGGKPAAVGELIKKYGSEGSVTAAVDVLNAISKDYNNQIRELLSSANNAIEQVWNEKKRLDEEVDLLWWHLGQQSFLLDRPLDSIPSAVRPIVIGADLAAMVGTLPGPYGVYGIARRALGAEAEKPIKLSEAVKGIDPEFSNLVTDSVADYAIAPVHGALSETLVDGTPVVATQFKRKTGLNFDVKLTAYELALQTYHEALLLKLDWFR